jgi:hypothetical protein
MRRFFITMLAVLTAIAGVSAAGAQVRVWPHIIDGGVVLSQGQPRVRSVRPRALISPSEAVMIAIQAMPGAKPLGVRQRGGTYVVRLRTGNKVVRVGVNSSTGAVQAIP